MNLTRTERLILSNQYQILEKLDPDAADYYRHLRKIVEHGYELHYEHDVARHIYEDENIVTEADCKSVLDTLSMHEAMKRCYDDLADKTGINETDIKFRGYDGSNETKMMSYAEFYVKEMGRFEDLDIRHFNSHCQMVHRYERMVRAWKESETPWELTRADLERILAA